MSDFCRGCRYNPKVRVGDDACPFTAGYWAFLHRNRPEFAANRRMRQAVRGMDRLTDLEALVAQETERGTLAP